MTDNLRTAPIQHGAAKKAMLASGIMLVLVVSAWAGASLGTPEAEAFSISSPFENGFLNGCVSLCMWDCISLAVMTLCVGYVSRLVTCAAVFAVRGVALGATVAFCFENAVGGAALGVIISFCAVTVLAAAYAVLLTDSEKHSLLCRILCYLTVSGAAAMLRIIPYLLL